MLGTSYSDAPAHTIGPDSCREVCDWIMSMYSAFFAGAGVEFIEEEANTLTSSHLRIQRAKFFIFYANKPSRSGHIFY